MEEEAPQQEDREAGKRRRSARRAPEPGAPDMQPEVGATRMQADVQQRFEEAYRSYMRALRDASSDDTPQKRAASVFVDYAQALLDARAPEDVLKRFDACLNYLRALQEVQREAQRPFEAAYVDYVRALQEAWAQVDVNALDTAALAAIGRSVAAACCAGSTLTRRRTE